MKISCLTPWTLTRTPNPTPHLRHAAQGLSSSLDEARPGWPAAMRDYGYPHSAGDNWASWGFIIPNTCWTSLSAKRLCWFCIERTVIRPSLLLLPLLVSEKKLFLNCFIISLLKCAPKKVHWAVRRAALCFSPSIPVASLFSLAGSQTAPNYAYFSILLF